MTTLTETEILERAVAMRPTPPKGRFKVEITGIPKYVPLHSTVIFRRKEQGSQVHTVTIVPSAGGQWGPEDLVFNDQKGMWMADNGSECLTFTEIFEPDKQILNGYFSLKGCVFGGEKRGDCQEDPDVGVWGAESPPKGDDDLR